ncbi:MAG: 6-phosphogluconolactonase [Hyphomicrobiales bacterium]|nr:MAG: 6-phosphogluconolactonase [Hyphomicrobiales bacterium]
MIARHDFENCDELALHLAERVAQILKSSINLRGKAALAVSGGSTPKLLFQHLSKLELDWSKVTVTLVDERLVPADSERSNERMVRQLLLKNKASAANFIGLTFENPLGIGTIESRVATIAMPFDAVILGMGNDGHTASYFPGGDLLNQAVSLLTKDLLCLIDAPGAGEPRITFTLPSLVGARNTFLHIEGDKKLQVLENALNEGEANDRPIRHILRHKDVVLAIYWSP